MRRRGGAALALVAALAAACAGGTPTPSGPPETRADFSRALLTYDTVPGGYFITADDTFVRTTGQGARQGFLDAFEVPVGPPTTTAPPTPLEPTTTARPLGRTSCGTIAPFAEPDPVALVVALDRTTQVLLVQAAGPAGTDLAALGRSVAACPTSEFGRLSVTSRVLPPPGVAADAVLAVAFRSTRDGRGGRPSREVSQVVGLAVVGPVLVGVWAAAEGQDVDPAVVTDALAAAVTRARAVAG